MPLATQTRDLAALVYRSRAVKALSASELYELMSAAQRRNGREAITGLMLYDNEHFFQWLEGPPDGVGRIMDSIRSDSRHTDIEVLDNSIVEERSFANWSMKLATPMPVMTAWRREVIEPPADIVETLRERPETARRLLLKLVPKAAPDRQDDDAPLDRRAADILRSVFLSSVLPQLLGHCAASQGSPARDHPRTAELAELLTASDQGAALQLIAELRGAGGPITPLYATLLEPAARRLGDMWGEDGCSEFDVTLGLCRLQTAVRLFGVQAEPGQQGQVRRPIVLIVPEPGELHRLGAALDGDVLRMAGWAPHCEYPADDQALQDLLAASWFDVLDLSLSSAFRRDDKLPQVAETIRAARRVSRNPDLLVAVGGRVFVEERTAGLKVGADLASVTSAHVDRSILRGLSAAVTATPSRLAELTAT